MKKNKRFAKFFVSFMGLFGLSLASCGSDSFHISLFIYSGNDTFMKGYSEQIQNTLEDKYELRVYDGEASQSYQNDQIVKEINDPSNRFLIINLVDRLAAKTIVEKAIVEEKPIIFINREPLEGDLKGSNVAYYVGAKPESDGELQAEIVDEYFGGKENFLEHFDKNGNGQLDLIIVKGEQGHQDTENRTQYSIEGLLNLGYNINILDSRFCDWVRESSTEYIKEIYDEIKDDADVVLSNNDDMALGIIDYLKSLENYDSSVPIYEQYFPIIGVDATRVGLEAIYNKEMYGTVKNNYEKQVDIIDKLIDYLLNEKDMSDFEYPMDTLNYFHTDGIKITQINFDEIIDVVDLEENHVDS